jgi:succinate dehydrogenase / fumarate reductase flavoprotein subunit
VPRVNQTLEKAGRVDDFFELGMLMCRDALERNESCGGHFRAEYQDEEGEAKRDDETSPTSPPGSSPATRCRRFATRKPLEFETVHLAKRSYK